MTEGNEPTVCVEHTGSECDGATFIRVCPRCNRFVKADEELIFRGDGQPVHQPNATCRIHGRVEMPFVGFY